MKLLHCNSMSYSCLTDDLQAARAAGFDGVELASAKVLEYLDRGNSVEDLVFEASNLPVTMINTLLISDGDTSYELEKAFVNGRRLIDAASRLSCGFLQVVLLTRPLATLDGAKVSNATGIETCPPAMLSMIAELAESAAERSVKLAIEPVVFSAFRYVQDALDLRQLVGDDRVSVVLDTWHLWCSGDSPEQLEKVEPDAIASVHVSDSSPRAGRDWADSDRNVLPGGGVVPVTSYITAIDSLRYRGGWAIEVFNENLARQPPDVYARQLHRSLDAVLREAREDDRS